MHSPMFSLEVFPPKRTSPVGTIYDTLDGLQGLDPDFISVTYGTGKGGYEMAFKDEITADGVDYASPTR
jgi:5,10-methylenetetrahydrofolate reductase